MRPGTDAARQAGCTCPEFSNLPTAHLGYDGEFEDPIDPDCPIHGHDPEEDE